MLYRILTLQGCYQVLGRCERGHFAPFYQLVNAPVNPRNLPEADVDLIVPTVPRAARVGVRVSAPLRRGAAPYADAPRLFTGSFTPLFLVHFECIIGFEGGFLHKISRKQSSTKQGNIVHCGAHVLWCIMSRLERA